MDDNLLSGEMSKHVELWNSLQFGPSDAMAEAALKTIIDDYIRLDLLTSTDDAAAVLDMAWNHCCLTLIWVTMKTPTTVLGGTNF